MKSNIIIPCALVILSACGGTTNKTDNSVSETENARQFVYAGNPLIRDKFTADPAPMVHDGKLYLYVGHDEYYAGQDSASGGKEFNITEWLCYSTEDMKTWTDHGPVLKPTDFKWAVGEAWASQVVEKDGKFYYYTTVQAGEPWVGKAVGVAVSDSPTGPFVDAIGKPLVSDDMTDNGKRGWWNDIDPTVLIDGDDAWLCWGNGTCFLAKLKPNMIEIDGEIEVVELPGYVEGPWLHKYNDTYYLTYASMGPGKETISYATAPSMKGPWTPQGELTGVAQNSFTIHPGIIEFNGTWYLFYHNAVLEIDGHKGAIGRRSVCVDTLTYDSVSGLMNPVVQKVAKEFTVDNEIAR
ncbi:MAG: glycoside hydrolase family 43 protein [Duncaniella sp.]|nr:glycoside hydrolase family 43 protein [Duncaniella sp.]